MNLDTELFLKINYFAQRTPQLHGIFKFVADFEIVVFVFLLLIGYGLTRRQSEMVKVARSIWASAGTVLAVGVNQPLVHLFHEQRPFNALQHILVLANRSHDFSFPSDHTVMAGAVTAGLFLVNRTLGYISLIFALLLAFSRVYIAAHWPQDVLAGLLVGATVSLIGYAIVKKPLEAFLAWLVKTPLRIFIAG